MNDIAKIKRDPRTKKPMFNYPSMAVGYYGVTVQWSTDSHDCEAVLVKPSHFIEYTSSLALRNWCVINIREST